ncbi:hypothetical protein [Paraburkholderia largidicola]|uniref:Uncharacterized protein n=1 Tax=Paraburkholderia largidicola TaxID=3014751 RepID=A0A7I8BJC2_9BURK|nr:hypothetical protein [Paraburkholderia sp. PGU16]BCF88712.1 hypothetical protein PPGU16_17790 [Paraburkholderia sp. PGU16]
MNTLGYISLALASSGAIAWTATTVARRFDAAFDFDLPAPANDDRALTEAWSRRVLRDGLPMSQQLREGLPELPARMRALPLDERGYPVPYFVAWIDGKPDFRVADQKKLAICHNRHCCWLCGEPLGKYMAFVIGPMCAVNRTSSEPPSHTDCAKFAASACPFLARPKAVRRASGLPEDRVDPAGLGLSRNPGVALVWVTRSYKPFKAPGGVLFKIGEPEQTFWYAEGRAATREEVMDSVQSGLPRLYELAHLQGDAAVMELDTAVARATRHFPRHAAAAHLG